MKRNLWLAFSFTLASILIAGCSFGSEPTPVSQTQEVVYDVPEEPLPEVEKEYGETIFGGPTKIDSGIPRNKIIGTWKNDDTFTSPATITFFIDDEGEFNSADSKFSFDYVFINDKLMYIRASTGKVFIDPNIEKFIGSGGQPATKEYRFVDEETLVIGDITFKLSN